MVRNFFERNLELGRDTSEMNRKIEKIKNQENKVHIFWEGHKILQNIHLTFDWHYIGHK